MSNGWVKRISYTRIVNGRRREIAEDDKERRLREVKAWLRSHGVCELCALGMALAQVEKEFEGAKLDAGLGIGCARARQSEGCEAIARRVWSTIPKTSESQSATASSEQVSRSQKSKGK